MVLRTVDRPIHTQIREPSTKVKEGKKAFERRENKDCGQLLAPSSISFTFLPDFYLRIFSHSFSFLDCGGENPGNKYFVITSVLSIYFSNFNNNTFFII